MKIAPSNKVLNICGTPVNFISLEECVDLLSWWIEEGNDCHQVIVANSHVIVLSQTNQFMKSASINASLIIPDGMPLVVIGKIRGILKPERIPGPEILERVLSLSKNFGWKHYFLGSTPENLDGIRSQIEQRFPGTLIAGMVSPPFHELSEVENTALVDKINRSGANILWVGLGCPKQEKWIFGNKKMLRVPVAVGVGMAFNTFSGSISRAPKWMQNLGLEWLYRVIKEPRRLWKRYLLYNSIFIYMVVKEQIMMIFKKF